MPDIENHLTKDEPTGNTAGIDADALLNQIESGQDVTPAAAAPTGNTAGIDAPAPVAQAPTAEEYEFTWNGKAIKADRQKVMQWANQGYDYAQKMQDYNRRNAEIERAKSELKSTYEPYEQINQYARKNPEWWNHVVSAYENRAQQAAQSNGGQVPPELLQKLDALEQFKTNFEQRISQEKREQEDQALSQDVQSIRKQYPNIDFDSPDQDGYSLEQRVMKHAVDSGINSYRAAFRDLRHDDLLKLAQEQAKEETAKALQSRTKQGILGKTPAPKTGLARAENTRAKTYDDLAGEALRELGIAH